MNRKERRRLNKLSRPPGASGRDSAARARPAEGANELLQQGFTCLGAGLFQDAQRLGQQVLALEPKNPEALNLCGIAAFQLGDPHQGLEQLQVAVRFKPDYAEGYNNLGNMLKAVGQAAEAEAAYRRSLEINPDYFDAHYNLAILLEVAGRLDEAEAAYRHAGDIKPDFAEIHFNLGNVLKAASKLEQAAAEYRRTVEMVPDHADAHNNLGSVLHELGEFDEATERYHRALEIAPAHAPAHYNLGITLQELGKFDEAIAAYQCALEHKPDYGEAHINLGYALQRSGKLDAAIAAYQRAIEIEPHNAQVHANLGDALLTRGDPRAAVEVCDDYLETHAGNTGVLAFKTVALNELGDPEATRFLLDFERFIRRVQITVPQGYASLKDFNTALAHYVSKHPTLVAAPTSHATRYGQHSGELLTESKGAIAMLETAIRGAVEEYRQSLSCEPDHPFVANPPRRFALTAWGVVMQSQGHQIAHNHPSAWLSGVYYVELPDVVTEADRSHEGWIEFGRPPEHFHCKAAPQVKLTQPEEGAMLLFPSYFYHRTLAFQSTQRRISIAFDVLPLPEG